MVAMGNARLVTAAVGAYALGRRGKGKAAIGLALRLSGARKEIRNLVSQDSSVLRHQGEVIALHLYEGMAEHLANALEHRVANAR